jgi:hypothetical protein
MYLMFYTTYRLENRPCNMGFSILAGAAAGCEKPSNIGMKSALGAGKRRGKERRAGLARPRGHRACRLASID